VFDVERRPWVDLSGAEADSVADAVQRCPTGALRYERLDGADGEGPERPTLVLTIEDGPLLMIGDLDVRAPGGEQITRETRLTLCRCGMTRNQPFCDNAHLRRDWQSGPAHEPDVSPPAPSANASSGPTTVLLRRDGPLELRGAVRIFDSDGRALAEAGRVLLCRCGDSQNKPFCDCSHERATFRSRRPEVQRDRLDAKTPAAFAANPDVSDPRRAR
jgi:CDGSH-type Zn-finger protein